MKELDKKLSSVVDSINNNYGKGSVKLFGAVEELDVPVIPTGSLSLDIAVGVGGYPLGRIIEILGEESTGKTTLALHAIAEAQRRFPEKTAAFIDAEHAIDKFYAQSLGVDVDSMLISQPDNGEQGLEIADKLIASGRVSIVVIDSVAALTPKAEIEGEMGESKMGLHARLMSQALRKMTASVSKTETLVIFLNQMRDKIGVMFGDPKVGTGGNALKFYATMRLRTSRTGSEKTDGVATSNKTKVKVLKNKVAPPFTEAIFSIKFGVGIDAFSEIVDAAVETEIFKKSGSYYSYGDTKLGQGKAAVAKLLEDNPELFEEVDTQVRIKLNMTE